METFALLRNVLYFCFFKFQTVVNRWNCYVLIDNQIWLCSAVHRLLYTRMIIVIEWFHVAHISKFNGIRVEGIRYQDYNVITMGMVCVGVRGENRLGLANVCEIAETTTAVVHERARTIRSGGVSLTVGTVSISNFSHHIILYSSGKIDFLILVPAKRFSDLSRKPGKYFRENFRLKIWKLAVYELGADYNRRVDINGETNK